MAVVLVDHLSCPGLEEAFTSLGFEVRRDVEPGEVASLGRLTLCLANMYRAAKSPFRGRALKRAVNAAGAPLVCWNRDGPSHMGEKAWRLWLLRHVSFMDGYAAHTLQDSGGFAPEVIYLANAAWHTRYHLHGKSLEALRDPAGYVVDVSFFGEIDPKRYPEMARRAEFFAALAPRLEAAGISHRFEDGRLTLEAQIELIQTSRINLNFHAGCDTRYRGGYRGEPTSWGLPERCYGIPAAGGFLLSDERAHAADDFAPGESWASFADLDDCETKIRHYLAHFDAGRAIAEAAHRRVMANHTYVHRARKLLDFVRYWRWKRSGRDPGPAGVSR